MHIASKEYALNTLNDVIIRSAWISHRIHYNGCSFASHHFLASLAVRLNTNNEMISSAYGTTRNRTARPFSAHLRTAVFFEAGSKSDRTVPPTLHEPKRGDNHVAISS